MPISGPDRTPEVRQCGQRNEIEVAGVALTFFKDRQNRHML
jgi:hypothetical protein